MALAAQLGGGRVSGINANKPSKASPIKGRPTNAKDALLHWCFMKTRNYDNVQIENYSSSWADGLAFCALLHHFFPKDIDYGRLSKQTRRDNFDIAFKVAEQKAKVYPLLETDDMIKMGDKPDWKCVYTYVQALYRGLKLFDPTQNESALNFKMNQEKEITPMLVFAIFSAVLGMFQFGFNTGVINAPQKVLEEFIANVYKSKTGEWISEEFRDLIWSLTVSLFAVGGMIGGIVAPSMAKRYGPKTGLVLNNTTAVIGVTLMSSSQLSQSIECLIIGRFFIGFNCGLNTALVPMYLTEIATVDIRGALGTVSQLGVTVGLLVSQVLGLKDILGNKEYWPFLFGFAFIPAILQLIMLPFCPESPRYLLLTCNRVAEARQALRRLRNSSDVEDDMEEMRTEDRAHQEEVRKYGRLTSIRELLNHPWLRTPLLIGVMMQLSQQLSGINAIFYYSTDIFLSAEVPENYAVYATMGVGAIMVIMTLVSIPLMDRLGRRTLHLYGLAGMFLASIFLTISLLVKFLYDWMKYISVISILFYTLFFGIGPGSIPLMITAELFTQGTRPAAMSVSVFVNWFSNFAVGLTFPLMKRVLQSYLFLPFTVFLAIFWIFTYKKLPETKNRTFEEIASSFKPLQLTGPASNYPDYGCTLASLGVADAQSMTPGSNQTPGFDGNNRGNGDEAHKPDKFRFDSAATGNYMNERHGSMGHNCTNGTSGYQSYQQNCSGSQGNLHLIPHTSCTSIAQNLSTNDQQPLIIDTQHDHCYQHQHFQQNSMLQNDHNNPNSCCLETTFMPTPPTPPVLTNCTCCEQEIKSARSPEILGNHLMSKEHSNRHRLNKFDDNDDDEDGDDDEPKRSRTLTRIYKPLNDTRFPSISTNNLVDNFYSERVAFKASDRL